MFVPPTLMISLEPLPAPGGDTANETKRTIPQVRFETRPSRRRRRLEAAAGQRECLERCAPGSICLGRRWWPDSGRRDALADARESWPRVVLRPRGSSLLQSVITLHCSAVHDV